MMEIDIEFRGSKCVDVPIGLEDVATLNWLRQSGSCCGDAQDVSKSGS